MLVGMSRSGFGMGCRGLIRLVCAAFFNRCGLMSQGR